MNTNKYTVGTQLDSWNGSTAQSLTFKKRDYHGVVELPV